MKTLSKYSRFHGTPLYADDSGNYLYAPWTQPSYGQVKEFVYVVESSDLNRPDLISYKLFNTVDLWWLILNFNKITDPFSLEVGQKLRIPNQDAISALFDRTHPKIGTSTLKAEDYSVAKTINPKILPFQRPPTTFVSAEQKTLFLFNYAFPVPEGLSGMVSFQLQISEVADFSVILTSKLTLSSTTGWFYYNPAANNGAGSFAAFPVTGIDGAAYASQPVYYKVTQLDLGPTRAAEYFFRWRTWINNIEGSWNIGVPLVIE